MGQLAGIYWFDRRPLDSSTRAALAVSANARTFEEPGLLMVWEDCSAATTISWPPSNACLLEGLIHNAKEASTGLAADAPASSASLALQLYERGGPAALGKLIGDWSLAIWDTREGSVVLSSDYAGARPLYYFRSDECLAWSSSLNHLAGWMNCRLLDYDWASEFLHTAFPVNRTPYRGIFPVPPGSAISASARGTARTEIWSLPLHGAIQYAGEGEYEEHFRELFQEAVAVRMQTADPLAAELSGGLDSSSIVCMADRLIATAAVPAPGMVTFSYLTPDSPDLSYIAIAEQACASVQPVHLQASDYPLLTPQTPGLALPVWAEARQMEVQRRMQGSGLRILLTGQLGDLITGNVQDDSEQAADYFCRGQVGAGLKEAFAWSRAQSLPVYPTVWRALKSVAERPFARGVAKAMPSRRKRLLGLTQLLSSRFFQCPARLSGLLYSHPFTHRPLVEFMLSIPSGIVCRPGQPRRLLRRALRGIVPDAILRRGSKGNYEGLYLQSLHECASWLLKSEREMVLIEMKQRRRDEVVPLLRQLSQGLSCQDAGIQSFIRLELWLRGRIEQGEISV